MIGTGILLIAITLALTAWLAHSNAHGKRQAQRTIEIITRGECCRGRILAIQRPFLLDSTTRLYFEFAPPGAERPVQCCHTERMAPDQVARLLPAVGTFVTVRYLPENPWDAVIGQ